MPRILGVDYGSRRIGLAVSDPSATIAQPLPTLPRRAGKRPPVHAISQIVKQQEIAGIVVGLPLTLAGDESDWTREVRDFGAKLAERTGVPVEFIDERMTSVRAEKAVRELGLKKTEREQKGRIDAASALLILQAHLDRRIRE